MWGQVAADAPTYFFPRERKVLAMIRVVGHGSVGSRKQEKFGQVVHGEGVGLAGPHFSAHSSQL